MPRGGSIVDALRGTTLGGFEILEPIGAGGMGTVFRARQTSIGRTVAVKVVREEHISRSEERFLREARAISQLNHPHIVQLIDFGRQPERGLMYYAMEYIEGVTLDELAGTRRLHPHLVIELALQVCSALAEAHSRGIVHRDLKASNMIVSIAADGAIRLRVLDFGIAVTFEDTANLTRTGMLCGTPTYMAPEQARGDQITSGADLYALGINLHRMLAGELPFDAASGIATVIQQVYEPPPTLDAYVTRGLVPESLSSLTHALLAKLPGERPAHAMEVRAQLLAIRQALDAHPIVVEPPSPKSLQRYTRPALRAEGDDVPPDWTFGIDGPTDPVMVGGGLRRPRITDTSLTPVLQREGAGWAAFNAAPTGDAQLQQALMVLNPVTGEYMSVSADDPEAAAALAPQPHRPAASAPPQQKPRGRVFSEDELIVDFPPPTTMTRVQPGSNRRLDVIKFVGVALFAFVLCLALVLIFASRGDDNAPRGAEEKEKTAPPEPKSIELFGNLPEDAHDKPPIIIEEERP